MFPQIFQGISVLDFSRLLPGPFASRLLYKMGAEVTCIVPPSGDPILGEYSPFPSLREGKKFLTLNLKNPEDLEKVRALIRDSDFLIEGFRPGAMQRLGLGFEEAIKLRPEIK